ncbi:MAG: HlyC/CorC family transporter [Ignavibacteriales bacterium]|nr:HlyC/CorC family transporter [Ignavibacteriales bacterium]
MLNDLFGLLLFLFLGAFFSASSAAFISANKLKLELRARQKNFYAENVLYFMGNPQKFFSANLIAKSFVNFVFLSLSSLFCLLVFEINPFVILLILTALLLIFGELIPKFLGRETADTTVLISALPMRIAEFILRPFINLTSAFSSHELKLLQKESEDFQQSAVKEAVNNLIEEGSENSSINEEQTDIINKVFEIREQRVYEAVTPRTDIAGVDISASVEEVLDKFIETGYSKLIVYEENLDNIKGMVFIRDFFNKPGSLQSVIRDVVFVPETKKSLEMLNEFLNKQFSIAVVVDEFGGTAGIITVEDLIEELFGEIRDEYDVEEKVVRKISAGSYILSGKVEIDFLHDEYELEIPEGEYETVAGYITYKLGRIPLKGESFRVDNFFINILKSDKKKIDLLKLSFEKGAAV